MPSTLSRPLAFSVVLVLLASAAVVVGAAPARAAGAEARHVIVQLSGEPVSARSNRAGAARDVRAEQADVKARAAAAGVRLTGGKAFTRLVNALAVRVPANQVDELRRVDGVRAVYEDVRVQAVDDDSVAAIRAPQVWRRDDAQGRPVRGAGQVVAVLDSGIDYTHPDLGGGFGPGHKVVGGKDLVNGDADPMDDFGHGTHVAGIIAGNGGRDGVTGVAPAAKLTAYKVLDRRGSAYSSTIIEALEAATDPANPYRASVVNMSLGGAGDGTDPLGQAATAAVRSGAVVVASAGNSGPGAQTILTPAAADGVLAVGASTTGVRLPTARLVRPRNELLQTFRVPFSANPPARPTEAAVVDVGDGDPGDFDEAGDVEGKVVLYRGPMPADPSDVRSAQIVKAREAERRGALAVIGWDPSSTTIAKADGEVHTSASGDDLRMDRLVVLGMDRTQYGLLAADLADGAVRVRISGTDATDDIGSFSSRGPSDRFGLKPDLVAPGVEIRSTMPKALVPSGVQRSSGTSMAAPHVAGAAALVRQLRPDRDADQVSGALVGTARRLPDAGPTTQGAGRLDVAAAADAAVTATPSSLSLGLVDLGARTTRTKGTVRLTNPTGKRVTATLRAERAPDVPGSVSVTPRRVSVPADGSAKVTVTVSAPRPTTDTDLGGWLVADLPGTAPDIRVPYLAVARPLVVQTSPDPSDGTSEAFVYSATPLASPPAITVHPPKGRPTTVVARHDHGTWYRVGLSGASAGTYRLEASVRVEATGTRLHGVGTFEVVPADSKKSRWEPVGPNSQAQFLATSEDDPDLGVATMLSDPGVWLTTDRGSTWRRLGRLPVAGGEGRVVVDPNDADTMWYALNGRAGAAVLDPTYEGKVLRSRDGGRTWTTLPFPNVVTEGFHLADDGRTLVAVTADTAVVSHDGGDTWTSHPIGSGSYVFDTAVSSGDLYLVRGSALQRVRDITGEPGQVETVTDAGTVRELAADERDIVVVGSDRAVRRSSDDGESWQTVYTLPSGSVVGVFVVDGEYYALTTAGRWWSKDRGATWEQYAKPFDGAVEQAYTKWPGTSGTLVASATNAGIFATDDRQNYRRIGVQGRTVSDLAVGKEPDGGWSLNAATLASLYRTALPTQKVTPATAEWGFSGGEARSGVEVRSVAAAPSDPRVMWRARPSAFSDFTVERSDDGGRTWTAKGRTGEGPGRVEVSPHDPDTVAVPFNGQKGSGIYTTSDGGANWRRLHQSEPVTALAYDAKKPNRLWIGTATGLYVSDEGGASPRKVTSGRVTAIGVDARTPSRIVVGGDTLRVSTDAGRTFDTASSGDLAMRVSDITVSRTDAKTLYAGTMAHIANGLRKGGRGVLRSTDGGRTWENVSTGLQQLDVTSLAQSADGRFLFAGTGHGGVHRLRLPR